MKMPTEGSKKKKQWGGKRPGAGAPPADTVSMQFTIRRTTVAILERIARSKGLKRYKGGHPFYGAAIDELASKVATPEPEYLKIAREIQEQASAAR